MIKSTEGQVASELVEWMNELFIVREELLGIVSLN